MLLRSLENDDVLFDAVGLDVFVGSCCFVELLTAFFCWTAEPADEFTADGGVNFCSISPFGGTMSPLALLFLHDSKIFLRLIASMLCRFNTRGFSSI